MQWWEGEAPAEPEDPARPEPRPPDFTRLTHLPRLAAGRLRPAALWARPISLPAPPGPRSVRRDETLCRAPFPISAAAPARPAPALRSRCERALVAGLAVLPL